MTWCSRPAGLYAVYRDREVGIAHVADSSEAPGIDPLDVGFHQATTPSPSAR